MKPYQICTRCVMDTTDPDITFDKEGVCNHCREYDYKLKETALSPQQKKEILENTLAEIRKAGSGKDYDCVIGLSGGVDSSYLAYLVKKQFNLRPLAVHLDNGWNSRPAVRNIQKLVSQLEIDLHTHVIDWEEFRDLQRAYFKASVIDIEVPTDHAIFASLYQEADRNNVSYILFGLNRSTEQILPYRWKFNKNDLVNLKAIHQHFGKLPLKTFPQMGRDKLKYYLKIKKIKNLSPLDLIPYNKQQALKLLSEQLGWVDYGGKHYESIFTRFYQGYILPKKFNVDKRKCHYSSLINSSQMTREQALEELKNPPYPESLRKEDYDYVIKKLGFSEEEFEEIMRLPVNSHLNYPTDILSKLDFYVFPALYPAYAKINKAFPIVGKVYKGINFFKTYSS